MRTLPARRVTTTGPHDTAGPRGRAFRTLCTGLWMTLWTACGLGAVPGLAIAQTPPTEMAPPNPGSASTALPLQSLPSLHLPSYLGTWYQVALFPNKFQAQCQRDTTATYRQRPDGSVDVLNRCRLADGRLDEAQGLARPIGTLNGPMLAPARLEVSFLPAALRWLPVGWGAYWVIQLADDGRYAVVSEPQRNYLWVLSRRPQLAASDETAIRSKLVEQGFGDRLDRWRSHPHE